MPDSARQEGSAATYGLINTQRKTVAGACRRAHASGSRCRTERDRSASSDAAGPWPHGDDRALVRKDGLVVAERGRRLRISRQFPMARASAVAFAPGEALALVTTEG